MSSKPRKPLIVFIVLVVFVLAEAVWWIIFMATMADEKVRLAETLGAGPEFVDSIHQEEISRQTMLGLEGAVFLIVILLGIWLIYRALRRTEELKLLQQNFLMAVTHELKTPLASLSLYLDSLKSEKIPDEKKRLIIPRMRNDVRRLETLVGNALDAGHFDSKGFHLNPEEVDLSLLVNECLDLLESQPNGHSLTISRRVEPDVLMIGDKIGLRRAIMAIIENSQKYHSANPTELLVSLTVEKDKILLSFSDNGIGIEREFLKKVFDRFYRVGDELTRGAPGTGLGLYLCREIILAHGGDVTASSEGIDQGSQFTIRLKRSDNR